MYNGFIKVAAASVKVRVADPLFNADALANAAEDAARKGVRLLTFPELSLTGCSCGDLFFSERLIAGAEEALALYLEKTEALELLSVVGLPLSVDGALYNAAAVCYRKEVLGVVPKTRLSARGAFAQARHFADHVEQSEIHLFGKSVPFGRDLVFSCNALRAFAFGVAFGAELTAPISLIPTLALGGATVICLPDASCTLVGSEEKLRSLVSAESRRSLSALIHSCAAEGESTTDVVCGGEALIAEAGDLLAARAPFDESRLTLSEIDVQMLASERRKSGFGASASCRRVGFDMELSETSLTRPIDPHPFMPCDGEEKRARCERILQIQTQGLMARIERAYAKKLVVGISGGLDSTLALLVMARAVDALKRPRTDILAVTMPCFGTTARTKNNATLLCKELGVDFRCVDIFAAVEQHFADIGHDPKNRDVTYENSQARERTQILMDVANEEGGMVIGTGDLSELALGWATYNGDHMSNYGVNGSIPKTLVRHLVAHCANTYEEQGMKRVAAALRDVLDTPVSPELLPADADGTIAQKTEDLVGPYELHDFYIYYMLRYGFSPKKLYRLAKHALGDVYDDETLKKWLRTLLRRFFSQQFKRSCLPDGPKVGSVSLSPRGDWCMPSDASAALWLAEADAL